MGSKFGGFMLVASDPVAHCVDIEQNLSVEILYLEFRSKPSLFRIG